MNLDDRIDTLVEKKRSISSKLDVLQDDCNQLEESVEFLKEEIGSLKSRIDTLNKSSEAVKKITEEVFRKKLQKYISLVNDGFETIFYDREMEFDVELDDRGSKKTVTLLYRKKNDDGNWSNWRELDNSSGGNIRAICDILSRIFLIVVNDRQRVLFFDESLRSVTRKYVDSTVEFLDSICERLDFDILFVSHDERFIQALRDLDSGSIFEMENGHLEALQS